MKKRTLLITLACAWAAATAPTTSKAEIPAPGALAASDPEADSQSDEETDCSKFDAGEIRSSIITELKNHKKAEKLGCSHVKIQSVKLVDSLTERTCPPGNEDSCHPGKAFTQEFKGDGFEGHVNVDWHFTRAGFTEWCEASIADCHKK